MKRVIALFLSLSFIFALVPAMTLSVSADGPSSTDNYLTFSSDAEFTLTTSGQKWDGTLYYSTDTNNWNGITSSTTLNVTSAVGNGNKHYLYLCGSNTYMGYDWNCFTQFVLNAAKSVSVSGNIMSLLSYTNLNVSLTDYCFYKLLDNCNSLTDASKLELPAETLAKCCYSYMFSNCKSLTNVPKLPAISLVNECYAYMFCNCKSLKEAPELKATTLAETCYGYMFSGCTSLISVPKLKATVLGNYCYANMFEGCTSLTDLPALPTTALVEGCYHQMFYNCSSIKLYTQTDDPNAKEYRIPYTGIGTIAAYALDGMFSEIDGPFTGTPDINTTYYFTGNIILPTSDAVEGQDDIVESDPDTDIEIGGKTVNVKYGNNTIVVNDKILEDVNQVDSKNVKIDFSKTGLDVDKVILQNDLVEEINEAGKGVEFITKNAYAILNELDKTTQNSITISLGEGIATHSQKQAMNTSEIIAEVNYSCTSNAKCLNTDAKIYIPCDYKNARVFYLIDENTIGEWPCEVVEGYCVFDRYQDGTYVVVK